MGKQAQQQRTALANALGSTGDRPVAPPALKKEEPKAPPPQPKKKATPAPEPEPKTKKELEEEQRQLLEEKGRQKKEWFEAEAAKKMQECVAADKGVTYVEDRDTRKPKAVDDLSEYWVTDLGALPFMPSDNVGAAEVTEGVDESERLEFLRMMSEQLRQVLRMRFNVFWSQVLFDGQLRRCLDSYLRFCLRRHDVAAAEEVQDSEESGSALDQEERKLSREISRRVLAIMVRLSRPQETSHDFISDDRYADFIYDKRIFDVPKLIDLCAVYGDANRTTVTKMVHSVFSCQPRYKADFQAMVRHMLNGLHQCCSPLQNGGVGDVVSELSVEECLTFLPDILSCFVAIFCFFPEDLVQQLVEGQLDAAAAKGSNASSSSALPLADVMVSLHEAVWALKSSLGDDADLEPPWSELGTVVALLSRLTSCVLGFRMAPRRGAAAFQELLDWLREQSHRGELLQDLARHGLENVAMEWCASGLVDDEQLDLLEELCGRLLPKEARSARRRPAARSAAAAAGGVGPSGTSGASGSSGSAAGAGSGASDAAKIREVREVVGTEYGDGFVLQCLLHYGGSVPAVVGAILDGSLPPQLSALPKGMKLGDAAGVGEDTDGKLTAEEKRRIMGRNDQMLQEEAARAERARAIKAGEIPPDKEPIREVDPYGSVYDDDADEDVPMVGLRAGAGAGGSDLDESDEDAASSSGAEGADPRWADGAGRKGKGKGRGKGKDKGPVQGQTIQARRKEENKAKVANHNRRAGAMAKMRKGMM